MGVEEFESLRNKIGEDLIVTDGTTLLGADDKAGIAEILTMAETILKKIDLMEISVLVFTPDEEVGRGPDNFNVEKFHADFAYTVMAEKLTVWIMKILMRQMQTLKFRD